MDDTWRRPVLAGVVVLALLGAGTAATVAADASAGGQAGGALATLQTGDDPGEGWGFDQPACPVCGSAFGNATGTTVRESSVTVTLQRDGSAVWRVRNELGADSSVPTEREAVAAARRLIDAHQFVDGVENVSATVEGRTVSLRFGHSEFATAGPGGTLVVRYFASASDTADLAPPKVSRFTVVTPAGYTLDSGVGNASAVGNRLDLSRDAQPRADLDDGPLVFVSYRGPGDALVTDGSRLLVQLSRGGAPGFIVGDVFHRTVGIGQGVLLASAPLWLVLAVLSAVVGHAGVSARARRILGGLFASVACLTVAGIVGWALLNDYPIFNVYAALLGVFVGVVLASGVALAAGEAWRRRLATGLVVAPFAVALPAPWLGLAPLFFAGLAGAAVAMLPFGAAARAGTRRRMAARGVFAFLSLWFAVVLLARWAEGIGYGFGMFALVALLTVTAPAPFVLGRSRGRCWTSPWRAIVRAVGRVADASRSGAGD